MPHNHLQYEAIEHHLRQFTRTPVYFAAGRLTESDSCYEQERQVMQYSLSKRKREFYSGRHLARIALRRAGISSTCVPRGPLGNPIWPDSIVGSITHDRTHGAAVVGFDSELKGLGLDLIEDPDQVTEDLINLIMFPDEQTLLRSLYPDLSPVSVAFSVKESVVKASSALVGRYMDLLDIRLDCTSQGLNARVNGLPCDLPCMVLQTQVGLVTSSFYPRTD
ncbi:4'-phosphopantetheinyl transferase entD [Marinobacter lipolyticus SM19]|uniref:Enterobactin synthase component D n=1 Tax=Marinobacter lipolyticus SM19 TaxID=1318628 RepID=R8B2B4_9GAMM|nr:4'-phosphopantetheinyl transferase superfamily protein [Marinobacter lipolyticus]EON92731.1 4'-phosphopantetheinyl transferase entD [Marinobacter lipolyticus SM19]